MKKILFIIIMLLTGVFAYCQAPNIWIQKADFGGTARAFAVGFSIGSKAYIGTGSDDNFEPTKDFWEYDPATNTWTQKADVGGTGRAFAAGFSIGSKAYIGTGGDNFEPTKDFWEYDPATNTWTQKADFGGPARYYAVGFSIGSKGYIGMGFSFPNHLIDFWEYDPATNTWIQKADFGGNFRFGPVGFSIGNKGYIGIGATEYDFQNDFWEYDPVINAWRQRADFGGMGSEFAAGFSIGSKGYVGTGIINGPPSYTKQFWEYDPSANTWLQKADFGGAYRYGAIGLSIGNKGYLSTGTDDASHFKDFWEYTPGNICAVPANLRVPKISDTAAVLKWTLPAEPVSSFKIRYRAVGDDTVMRRHKTGTGNRIVLTGLLPNTTYEWQIRSNCATGTTDWVCGPNFTTTCSAAFSSRISAVNSSKFQGNASLQIMPNPSTGNFTVQMHLPDKAVSTTLSLYSNTGEKIWLQHAGKLSGSVSINIALENKLPAGMYVLIIQHSDTRLVQKVVVSK